jgi:long-chain acyl-CoA synthetase
MVSGGSALPLHIASFFDMAGLLMVAGYGLTETSPTLASSLGDRNVLGSVGRPPKGIVRYTFIYV